MQKLAHKCPQQPYIYETKIRKSLNSPSIDEWRHKVLYPHDRTLFSNKRKQTTDAYYTMYKPQKHHAE